MMRISKDLWRGGTGGAPETSLLQNLERKEGGKERPASGTDKGGENLVTREEKYWERGEGDRWNPERSSCVPKKRDKVCKKDKNKGPKVPGNESQRKGEDL